MLKGLITAMLTPFDENENIDFEGTKILIDMLINNGVNGLFILGTNGEFTNLSYSEKVKFAEFVNEYVADRIPLIIGVGECSTKLTIQLIKDLKHLNPYAFSVITPYFHKLSDLELYNHFLKITENINHKILLYNIPKLTGNTISIEIYKKLLEKNNIIGIKDSSGSIDLLKSYCKVTTEDKGVYIGSDSLFLEALKLGVVGGVSGLSNVIAEDFLNLYDAYLMHDENKADFYQNKINNFRLEMKTATAPSMLKYKLSQKNVIKKYTRSPIQSYMEEKK